MALTEREITLFSPLIAAKPKIRSYPGWTTGSGLEEFNQITIPWGLRIKKQAWESSHQPFLIRWLMGLLLYVYPPEDESTRVIYLTGYFEPNEFNIFKKFLEPRMVFLDVGANMGLYSIFASKKVGKSGLVVSIEPSSREFERLQSNVEVNRLQNVKMIQVAVSRSEGEADLLVATNDHAGHNTLGNFAYEGIILKQKEHVTVKTIDSIVSDLSLSRLDVIKMDIEGSEFFALEGAKRTLQKFKPVLMLELFNETLKHQGCNGDMILQFLASLGYIIYGFDEHGGLSKLNKVDGSSSQNIFAIHTLSKVKW